VDGISGKALNFNGNAYIEMKNFDIRHSTGTIEVWALPRTTSKCCEQIFSMRDSSLNYNVQFFNAYDSGTSKNIISFWMAAGDMRQPVIDIRNPFPRNEWTYIVVTQDGSKCNLYINGKLEQSAVSGKWFDDLSGINEYNIGRLHYMANYYYNGIIDEVAIYSRALSQSEIQSHYLAKRADPASTPTLTQSPGFGAILALVGLLALGLVKKMKK